MKERQRTLYSSVMQYQSSNMARNAGQFMQMKMWSNKDVAFYKDAKDTTGKQRGHFK